MLKDFSFPCIDDFKFSSIIFSTFYFELNLALLASDDASFISFSKLWIVNIDSIGSFLSVVRVFCCPFFAFFDCEVAGVFDPKVNSLGF